MTDALPNFQKNREILFSIAHRMLGSVSEAEDVMQEAWLRWSNCNWQKVENESSQYFHTCSPGRKIAVHLARNSSLLMMAGGCTLTVPNWNPA